MKCMSRSTLGVVIGTINIVFYVLASIGCLVNIVNLNSSARLKQGQYENVFDEDDDLNSFLEQYNDEQHEREMKNLAESYGNIMFSVILVLCLCMVLISALLVVGITKKRHTLMAPWVILSIVGFVVSCIRAVILLFQVMGSIAPFSTILYVFVIICLTLGLQALIIYPIYTLYRDMRTKNNERPGQVITATSVGYPAQAPYYSPIPAKA